MIVLDVETTGTRPSTHGIVSIGAVDFARPHRRFAGMCRIPEGTKVDPFALKVNGFTVEQLHDPNNPTLRELLEEFVIWFESVPVRTLAGHNVDFDRDFLRAELSRSGLRYSIGSRIVDLHGLAFAHHLSSHTPLPLAKYRSGLGLNEILAYVGLPPEPDPHEALTGAIHETEAFGRLIYGRPYLEEFQKFPVPEYLR